VPHFSQFAFCTSGLRSGNEVYKGIAYHGNHNPIDPSKTTMLEKIYVQRDRLLISRSNAMFCKSLAVNMHLDPYSIFPHSPDTPVPFNSRDDNYSFIQRKSHWTSISYLRLINLKPVNYPPFYAADNTIDVPWSTPSSLTTRSNSTRKMTTFTGISLPEIKKRRLSKANTLPNLTASNNASLGFPSTTLHVCKKTLCIKTRTWLHRLMRTEQTIFHTTYDGSIEAIDLNDSSNTLELEHNEESLQNADCLLERNAILELQEELMLLFHDAKKCGFVVEAD